MLRSLFTGVSGLKNHQTRLDVIANNLANINTFGFKKGRVTFKDVLSQTLAGAAIGGTNPKQVGLGMSIGSIENLFMQGNLQVTEIITDMAIQGNGMFVLSDGISRYYTRAGNFMIDSRGRLVSPTNGFRVQGWQADSSGTIDTSQPVSDIVIPVGSRIPARATQNVDFIGNLNSNYPIGTDYSTSITIYDSLGGAHNITFNFRRTAANTWTLNSVTTTDSNISNITVGAGTLPLVFDPATGALLNDETVPITITYVAGFPASSPQTINANFDIGSVTQYNSDNDMVANYQDGYTSGSLLSFNVSERGVINGIYSNGLNQNLAQIALAHFTNYAGLLKTGDNMFLETISSGNALIGEANTGGRGSISAGTLEMSNVDLSEEFTSMITAQRGLQANSRSIITSDEILQELLNLKR